MGFCNQNISSQCAAHTPCYDRDACVNLVGGFRCRECPPGFFGEPVSGSGLLEAESRSQVRFLCSTITFYNVQGNVKRNSHVEKS